MNDAAAQVSAADNRTADLEARVAKLQTALMSQSQEMVRLQAQVLRRTLRTNLCFNASYTCVECVSI